MHQERAPLLRREGTQGGLQPASALGNLELVLCAGGFVGDCLEQGGIFGAGSSATLSPPRVETDVTRDAQRPGAQWHGRRAALAILEHTPEYFGDAVIDLCAARDEAEHVARNGHDRGAKRRELLPSFDLVVSDRHCRSA
jgi:hypothetical protein